MMTTRNPVTSIKLGTSAEKQHVLRFVSLHTYENEIISSSLLEAFITMASRSE